MTDKDVFQQKDLLQKAAAIKRFEYPPLGSELKKRTSVAEKQCQGLNKLFTSSEKEESVSIKKEKPAINYESKPMYDNKYDFGDFSNIKKYYVVSYTSKYNKLLSFYHWLNKFRKTKIKKTEYKKILQIYMIH